MIGLFLIGLAAFFIPKNIGKSTVNEAALDPDFSRFDELFKKYAAIYGLDWKMLKRIAYIESTLGKNPRVKKGLLNPNDVEGSKSEDGKSWGIMQVTVTTAKDYDQTASPQKLNNPEFSIKIACQHIKLIKRYFSNERDILMAYNQGQGNQLKFVNAEKSGTLKVTEYPAARAYWNKYKLSTELFK